MCAEIPFRIQIIRGNPRHFTLEQGYLRVPRKAHVEYQCIKIEN